MAPAVELLPEIWLKVIQLLRVPLPRPTGNNPRSSIRQHTLTICMRVNKLFNNITAPLLYSIIVTDHLPSLIYGHDLPSAASGIPSKLGLLGNLAQLYLEYSPKDHSTYEQICREGKRHYEGVGLDQKGLMGLCEQECDAIATAGSILKDCKCRKRSLSTGAFLQPQTAVWDTFMSYTSELGSPRLDAARQAISDLTFVPYPTFYCNKALSGPLVFSTCPADEDEDEDEDLEPAPGGPTDLVHCSHIPIMGSMIEPPLLTGSLSTWYIEYGDFSPGATASEAPFRLARIIGDCLEERESVLKREADQLPASDLAARSAILVDIYLPATMLGHRSKERFDSYMRGSIQYFLDKFRVPRERSTRDQWRFLDLESAPACRACSWGPDDA